MPVSHIAENVFGTMGAVCWTVQLLPQIWKSWHEHSTHGLSPWLMFIWGIAGAFLGTYVVVQNLNVPLIIQPQIFTFLAFVSWGQCQYYGQKRSRLSATFLALLAMVTLAAFEVGMVYAIRPSYQKGNNAGIIFFGVGSSVTITIGLFPQYWEIFKYREVIGVSYLFIFIDLLGGIFSDLSLVFKGGHVDVLAVLAYTLVIVVDGVVLLLALILNPRAARRRREEAEKGELGETYDTRNKARLATGTDSLPETLVESGGGLSCPLTLEGKLEPGHLTDKNNTDTPIKA